MNHLWDDFSIADECENANDYCIVTENAYAPDDSGIRPKEARGENRTVRHGSCQVSVDSWNNETDANETVNSRSNDLLYFYDQSSSLLSCQIQIVSALANVSDSGGSYISCINSYVSLYAHISFPFFFLLILHI